MRARSQTQTGSSANNSSAARPTSSVQGSSNSPRGATRQPHSTPESRPSLPTLRTPTSPIPTDANDFARLPKKAKDRLARMLDLIDMTLLRAVSKWHREFADRYLAMYWVDRLEHSYPVLAFSLQLHRRALSKGDASSTTTTTTTTDESLDPRKAYIGALVAQFESDPEAINPFDPVSVLLLFHNYKEKVNRGELYLSLHNFCVLVVLYLKLRHGIFKSDATTKEIEEIIAARYDDKRGKLREEVEKNWQSLSIPADTLIVNADLKRFVSTMRRSFFLKLQYVMFVSTLPHFPMLVVDAKQVLPGKKKLHDVALGVGKDALVLIDEKTSQVQEQFEFQRVVSWAHTKEVFSFKVRASGSRKKADEVIFISPDAQQVADAVSKAVDALMACDVPLAALVKEEKKEAAKLIEEFMLSLIAPSSQSSKKDQSVSEAQDKKLRRFCAVCATCGERFAARVALIRRKENFKQVLDMIRKSVAFLQAAKAVEETLRKAARNVMDVDTTVQVSTVVKAFASAMNGVVGEDREWTQQLDAVLKRAEEST